MIMDDTKSNDIVDVVTREFDRLNDEQRAAVAYPEKSCLILAGAGSGKTSVLTTRIAALMSPKPVWPGAAFDVGPEAILAVTFTNKAADEMRKRLSGMVGRKLSSMVWMGTFHSICLRMLRENHEPARLPKNFAVIDPDAQEMLMRGIINPMKARGDLPLVDWDTVKPGMLIKEINANKERHKKSPIASLQGSYGGAIHEDDFRTIFAAYETECERQGLLDFNDLLDRAVTLLLQNPAVAQKYQSKFRAILVDEFQDTNDIQYQWLRLIRGERSFVLGVGDDDQSIYSFRGANPSNMRAFQQDIARGNIIRLERNYRSHPHILNAANALIAQNKDRLGKNLWTDKKSADAKINFKEYMTEEDEARDVAIQVKNLLKPVPREGSTTPPAIPANEIAVLYRTNQQSRLLEQEFNKLNIPVTVYGGFKFFERQEVKRVLAYIDLVSNNDRDISFTQAVGFPVRGIGEATIADIKAVAEKRGRSIFQEIVERSDVPPETLGNKSVQNKQKLLEQFVSMILDFGEMAEEMPLHTLMSEVINRSGIRAMYEAEKTEEAIERLANLDELVCAAASFSEESGLTTAAKAIPEYLAMVQLATSTSEADMNKKGTVSLMTVHASKGLEFDSVFVTGMENNTFPHSRAIQEKNTEEERRLAYVAVTRAKRSLRMSMCLTRLEREGSKVSRKERQRSMFIDEIPSELLKLIPAKKEFGRSGDFSNPKPAQSNVNPPSMQEAPSISQPSSEARARISAMLRRR